MNYRTNPKKEQFWQMHILQASQFEGGLAAYCRNQNISINNLSYWRKRFPKSSAIKSLQAPSAFLPVKLEEPARIVATSGHAHPDPKWVAAIIFELHLRGNE